MVGYIEGKKHIISFRHNRRSCAEIEEIEYLFNIKIRNYVDIIRITRCDVVTYDSTGVNDIENFITRGFALCREGDIFEKKTGCQKSLANALKHLTSRNYRKQIAAIYDNRFFTSSAPKPDKNQMGLFENRELLIGERKVFLNQLAFASDKVLVSAKA